MIDAQQARSLFDTARRASERRERYAAVLGDGSNNLFPNDVDGNALVTHVWARIDFGDDGGIALRVVRCRKVLAQYGLYVWVGYDVYGNLEVVEEDADLAGEFGGGRNFVPAHAWQHRGTLAPDYLLVEGLQIRPLQVSPAFPRSLSVTVVEYSYTYNGTNKTLADTTVDLTSYVPTTPAGGQTFVVLSLNPSTNAVAVTAYGTTTVPITPGVFTNPFTAANVNSVSVPSGNLRIAAVRLYQGQTEVSWIDIFRELRESAGGAGGAVGGIALGDLSDVTVSSAAQGDILTRDTDDWQNYNIGTNQVVHRSGSGNVGGLAMAASTILARLASGDIVAATLAQIADLLGPTLFADIICTDDDVIVHNGEIVYI